MPRGDRVGWLWQFRSFSAQIDAACSGQGNNRQRAYIDFQEDQTFVSSGALTSSTFDTSFGTATYGPLTSGFSEAAGGASTIAFAVQVSTDGTFWQSAVAVSTGDRVSTSTYNNRYARYIATLTSNNSTTTAQVNDVSMFAIATGTYYSEVKNIGVNISTWLPINFTETSIPSGRASYAVRTATFSFAPNAATPAWTSQTNNQIVEASTNAYVQLRIISSVKSSTETLQLDQALTEWKEGSDKRVGSVVKERRFMMSVTTSLNNAENDTVLVLQKNDKWTMFTGPSYSSLALYNNEVYAGDSSTNSYIWKTLQKDIYNDDGAAIKSKWITKDYMANEPTKFKSLYDIWVETSYSTNTLLTVGYSVDKNTLTTKTVDLGQNSLIVNKRVPVVDGFAIGKYLRFGILNSQKDQYFRLHSLSGFYNLQPQRLDDNE